MSVVIEFEHKSIVGVSLQRKLDGEPKNKMHRKNGSSRDNRFFIWKSLPMGFYTFSSICLIFSVDAKNFTTD